MCATVQVSRHNTSKNTGANWLKRPKSKLSEEAARAKVVNAMLAPIVAVRLRSPSPSFVPCVMVNTRQKRHLCA